MQLEATIILKELDLTEAGRKLFEENGKVSLLSFKEEIRYACIRSNLVLFVSNSYTTNVLRNRYGDIGIVKTGKYYGDEKHKRYRPFMNRAEVEPFWDKKLKFKDSNDSIFRINVIGSGGVSIGSSAYSYSEAFEQFECVDGTPFGVEVL